MITENYVYKKEVDWSLLNEGLPCLLTTKSFLVKLWGVS